MYTHAIALYALDDTQTCIARERGESGMESKEVVAPPPRGRRDRRSRQLRGRAAPSERELAFETGQPAGGAPARTGNPRPPGGLGRPRPWRRTRPTHPAPQTARGLGRTGSPPARFAPHPAPRVRMQSPGGAVRECPPHHLGLCQIRLWIRLHTISDHSIKKERKRKHTQACDVFGNIGTIS